MIFVADASSRYWFCRQFPRNRGTSRTAYLSVGVSKVAVRDLLIIVLTNHLPKRALTNGIRLFRDDNFTQASVPG